MNEEKETTEEYPYSIGTTPTIATIQQELLNPTVKFDTVLFNMSTMLRNSYLPDQSIADWVSGTFNECMDVALEVTNCDSIVPVRLAFYHMRYDHLIPDNLVRPMTGQRKLIADATKLLINLFKASVTEGPHNDDPIVYHVSPMRADPNDLGRFVRNLKTMKHVLHVTHVPLDYHMSRRIKKYKIIYSFTGESYTILQMGNKMYGPVPFNIHTHATLGDSATFKSVLNRKLKKEFFKIAEKEKWLYKSEREVLRRMHAHQFAPPFKICN